MAGIIPSFLSSAKLAIHIGNVTVGYATNLSISDSMNVAAVGGIGSYMADALEPTQYSVRGSFTISIYDEAVWDALKTLDATKKYTPDRAVNHSIRKGARGNSMLTKNSFSPFHLMISKTFDINVYERNTTYAEATDTNTYATSATYAISDCRLTSYSISFTPGAILQENVGFIAMKMSDCMASATVTGAEVTTPILS